MKKRIRFLVVMILLSWGLEFIWIRFDQMLEVRIAGIHFIPLFIVQCMAIWFLYSEGVNLIEVISRAGRVRWWLFSFMIPVLAAGAAASVLIMLRLIRFSGEANVETRIISCIVDLPLNYVLWFPVVFSTEICWRGAFGSRNGARNKSFRDAAASSLFWALSLCGLFFTGYSGKTFSLLTASLSIVSVVFIGLYQSMIYRRSGSLLLSSFSMLCIILGGSLVFEFPLVGIQPFLEVLHPASVPSTLGIFIVSCLLGAAGVVMWDRQNDATPTG